MIKTAHIGRYSGSEKTEKRTSLVKNNLMKRARLCIDNGGGHFEGQLKYL